MLIISPLSDVPVVIEALKPSHMVSLLDPGHTIARPSTIGEDAWLRLDLHDIHFDTPGMVAPSEAAVRRLLAFAELWDETAAPMLIHCLAGISRSTASAFIVACAKHPHIDETAIALQMRDANAVAFPNRALVAHADRLLGRGGRMIAGVEAMGHTDMRAMQTPFQFWPIQG
jgi:predicted protein tyrosine phosphatase